MKNQVSEIMYERMYCNLKCQSDPLTLIEIKFDEYILMLANRWLVERKDMVVLFDLCSTGFDQFNLSDKKSMLNLRQEIKVTDTK